MYPSTSTPTRVPRLPYSARNESYEPIPIDLQPYPQPASQYSDLMMRPVTDGEQTSDDDKGGTYPPSKHTSAQTISSKPDRPFAFMCLCLAGAVAAGLGHHFFLHYMDQRQVHKDTQFWIKSASYGGHF